MNKFLQLFAIGLGSFLSFALEPLVGRTLLASFGGTAAVWMTCLTAFQVLLVAGYFYAHLVCARPSRGRLSFHLLLLAVAALWCAGVAARIFPVESIAGLGVLPVFKAALAILVVCAVPFVVLSANSSLVQVLAGNDYRLYAVSNVGSLAGLAAYPFLIEPFLSISAQWQSLAGGIAVYAVCVAVLAFSVGAASRRVGKENGVPCSDAASCRVNDWSPWFALSAVGVALLNAVTAHMTGNVAPIPLLWAMLLAIYLLTFVIGFSRVGEFLLPLWNFLAVVAAGGAVVAFCWSYGNNEIAFVGNMAAASSLLLFGGLAVHSGLYARRPSGAALTRYYLVIALGGAVGGILTGLVVPVVFDWVAEYPAAIVAAAVAVTLGRAPLPAWGGEIIRELGPNFRYVPKAILAVLAVGVWIGMCSPRHDVKARGRSFYGAWTVKETLHTNVYGKQFHLNEFQHGGTLHGLECVESLYRDAPTAYYGPRAGGFAFTTHPDWNRRGLRAGLVGMGVGTLAWYEREQDAFDFFEICPEVIGVAKDTRFFHFLSERKGKGRILEGDARPLLEAQRKNGEEKYDVIVVDAYSGDSIPYHLVTKEAFELYRDRLAPGGTLALHITNWHIDLYPVVKAAAKSLGLRATVIADETFNLTIASNWAFLSEKPLDFPPDVPKLIMEEIAEVPLPTDAKGSLIRFIKWCGSP